MILVYHLFSTDSTTNRPLKLYQVSTSINSSHRSISSYLQVRSKLDTPTLQIRSRQARVRDLASSSAIYLAVKQSSRRISHSRDTIISTTRRRIWSADFALKHSVCPSTSRSTSIRIRARNHTNVSGVRPLFDRTASLAIIEEFAQIALQTKQVGMTRAW